MIYNMLDQLEIILVPKVSYISLRQIVSSFVMYSLLVEKSDTQLAIVPRSRNGVCYDDLYHSCPKPSTNTTPV